MSNQITILGNLGKDAELAFSPKGDPYVRFSLADNVGYGDKKHTLWWKAVLFGKRAEKLSPFLKKGSAVVIFGEVQGDPATGNPKLWTSNSGETKASFEMMISEVWLTGKPSENSKVEGKAQQAKDEEDMM